jgi:hypothetical protein
MWTNQAFDLVSVGTKQRRIARYQVCGESGEKIWRRLSADNHLSMPLVVMLPLESLHEPTPFPAQFVPISETVRAKASKTAGR